MVRVEDSPVLYAGEYDDCGCTVVVVLKAEIKNMNLTPRRPAGPGSRLT
jgi:hypothetical protein